MFRIWIINIHIWWNNPELQLLSCHALHQSHCCCLKVAQFWPREAYKPASQPIWWRISNLLQQGWSWTEPSLWRTHESNHTQGYPGRIPAAFWSDNFPQGRELDLPAGQFSMPHSYVDEVVDGLPDQDLVMISPISKPKPLWNPLESRSRERCLVTRY